MRSLREIASELGYSEATVSNALSGKGRMKPETRDLIIKAVEKTDYQYRHTSRFNQNSVVIIQEEDGTFNDEIVNSLLSRCTKAGVFWPVYKLEIFSRGISRDADASVMRPLLMKLLDSIPYTPSGMVYVSQYPRKIPGYLDSLNFPIVGVQMLDSGADVYINSNDQQGAYDAIQYMYHRGKRRIAMIAGQIDTYSSSERLIGYQRGLIDCHIPYHPKLIWVGDWSQESGYELTEKLLNLNVPIDSIFTQNDYMAFGAIRKIKERNLRIPEDISIIGFDNSPDYASKASPELTTVSPPRYIMGSMAFDKMLSLLRHNHVEDSILKCDLCFRESCK